MPKALPLTEAEIAERLSALSGWTREGMVIKKTYTFNTYLAGVAFAAAVGTVCEGLDHHPDLWVRWRKVEVSFTTHDSGNQLTANDFNAAQAVDALGYPKAT
jgi:4a-hydroxytetrahydrobiopterin dehydratase